ncbi:MAG TPA: M48 family peptidase [Candidatus Moranbacteria bacterium]|nr:M48 family peptidase [Candidatus Moranbacteria bacterium]HAT75044.1 M48 family peptidase [Candidatus Moranbacteria bacterium]
MPQIKISKIIRSKRKSLALAISSDATLIVRAPMKTSLEYIEKIVAQKSDWIARKMREIQRWPKAIEKKFIAGEEFSYLGEKYQLEITESLKIKLNKNSDCKELFFPKVFLWRAKERMFGWYKKQALQEISSRAETIAQKLNLNYQSIKISSAKTNWGSCGPKNSLNFNWRLIMAPESVIEYVIIHELTHILEKNHSRKFWNKVEAVMPEYKKRRKWLRENGKMLVL